MTSFFLCGLLSLLMTLSHNEGKQKIKFKRKSFSEMLVDEKSDEVKELDYKLLQAGLPLNGKQYQLLRYSLMFVLFSLWAVRLVIYKESSMLFPISIILFVITSPKEKLLMFPSPFSKLLESSAKSFQKKKDIELYNIVSQLKNMCLSTQGTMGTDYVLNEIVNYTKYTRSIFTKFISLWNIDRKDEAVEQFNREIGSLLGQELSAILYKFDSLEGKELVNHLDLYQNSIRQEKETHRVKVQERKTTLLYFSAITVVVLILINLIVTLIFSNLADQILFNM